MRVIHTGELERLVHMAFPQKGPFSAEMELAGKISRPLVAFVQAGNKICWEAPLHEPPLYRVAR